MTLSVRIPYAMWFECQLYLTQNYIMPIHDYKLSKLASGTYTIEFYSKQHYEQFWDRYWSRLHMY